MGQRERVGAGGQVTLGDARAVLGRVEEIYNEFQGLNAEARLAAAAARAGVTQDQFVQLRNLKRIADQDYMIQEEMKKTSDDTFGSLKNIEERSTNFFDNNVPMLLGYLAVAAGGISQLVNAAFVVGAAKGFNPLVMTPQQGTAQSRVFGGQGAVMRNLRKAGGFLKTPMGAGGAAALAGGLASTSDNPFVAGAGTVAQYAGMGAMIGGGIPGAIVGGAIGLTMAIVEELEKQRANQERKDREQAAARSQEASQMQFTAEYLRRSTREAQVSDPKTQQMLADTMREMRKMNNLLEARGKKGTLPIGDQ
jgi:hypothetical protein